MKDSTIIILVGGSSLVIGMGIGFTIGFINGNRNNFQNLKFERVIDKNQIKIPSPVSAEGNYLQITNHYQGVRHHFVKQEDAWIYSFQELLDASSTIIKSDQDAMIVDDYIMEDSVVTISNTELHPNNFNERNGHLHIDIIDRYNGNSMTILDNSVLDDDVTKQNRSSDSSIPIGNWMFLKEMLLLSTVGMEADGFNISIGDSLNKPEYFERLKDWHWLHYLEWNWLAEKQGLYLNPIPQPTTSRIVLNGSIWELDLTKMTVTDKIKIKETSTTCIVSQYNDMAAITFTASNDLQDWLENFDYLQETYQVGGQEFKCHRGIWRDVESIYYFVKKTIQSSSNVLICGYSLGGAMSVILARRLAPLFTDKQFAIASFDGPRVGNKAMIDQLEALPNVNFMYNLWNYKSLIPSVPPLNIRATRKYYTSWGIPFWSLQNNEFSHFYNNIQFQNDKYQGDYEIVGHDQNAKDSSSYNVTNIRYHLEGSMWKDIDANTKD